MDTQQQIVSVALSNGEHINVEATIIKGEQDIAAQNLSFENITTIINGLSNDLVQSLKKVKPNKASIEFGVEFGVEAGQLTAILVQGTGSASLKITLEWGDK